MNETHVDISGLNKHPKQIEVGQWYINDCGDVYLVAHVGKIGKPMYALINIYGNRYGEPCNDINDVFVGGEDHFNFLPNVKLSLN